MNQLIATHNSATGEKPANILSWFLIPFCRTQSKTIKEQYEAGCRLFDLRAREYKGNYHAAHGLYVTKKTLTQILREIDSFPEKCHVTITYEGKIKSENQKEKFLNYIDLCKNNTRNILWGSVFVKYTDNDINVDWVEICNSENSCVNTVQGFVPLDGKSWQTYLPIPWVWKKIYFNKPNFNDKEFTYVDFL